MANCVEEMCLSQADTSIHKEWVEAMTGLFHNGLGRGMGQTVVVSDHECVESIAGIEHAALKRRVRPGYGSRSGGPNRIAATR